MFKSNVFRLVIIPVISLLLAFAYFASDKGTLGMAATQPEDYAFVRMAGIDITGENEDKIRLTLGAPNPQGIQGSENNTSQVPYVISIKGKTVFDANRRMHLTSDLDIFWGHVMYLVLGEATAKEDVSKYVDFFIRDHESRFSVNLLVAKELTAEEVIKEGQTSLMFLSDRLKAITDNAKTYTVSQEVNLLDFAQKFSGDSGAAFAPCMHFSNTIYYENKEDKGKKSIELCGYAVFKKGKLVGYLENGMSRGFDFIMGEVKTTSLPVKSKEGIPVSMEVISSHSKIEPNMENGKPSVTITIEMETNVAEIEGSIDVFTQEGLAYLKKEQNGTVLNEVSGVLRMMQQKGTDIFDFAGAFKHKYTDQWKTMKKDWENIFKAMEIKVNLYSVIRRTYNINEPITGKE